MPRYYDRNGNPLSTDEWVEKLANDDRQVALDELPNGAQISTVWLGLDHQFGDGPPLIFETMIFGPGPHSDEQWRYSTEEQALAGHAHAVALASEGKVEPDA